METLPTRPLRPYEHEIPGPDRRDFCPKPYPEGWTPPPPPVYDPPLSIEEERALYPVHEDNVAQGGAHGDQYTYLVEAVRRVHPERWIEGDFCVYWEPGNTRRYLAPDLMVAAARPADRVRPDSYMAWRDAPLLFVAEVGSRRSVPEDVTDKLIMYERELRVPEYLFAYPSRGDLRLWRLKGKAYEAVEPNADGRFWSEELGVWFGYDAEGFLRVYDAGGEMLLRAEEMAEAQAAAEAARAEAERARAEAEQARVEAEARLLGEAAQRQRLEQELAALRAELQRLRPRSEE